MSGTLRASPLYIPQSNGIFHSVALGVATVVVDGQLAAYPRSEQTPPPTRFARLERGQRAGG